MAKVFNYITINYEKDIYTPSIDMMQGDTGRGLIFNIASPIDGLESDLSNLTATLNVVKPTGETQTATGTIESLGNGMAKVTIEPSSSLARAINVSGLANATLVIANTTQTVTSFNFKIKIKPNPFYPKPTVRKFDVTKVSRITGVQQYEHCVQSIEFVGLDYTGNMYIVLNNDTFVQDSETEGYHNTVPLTNNTFIIGQPMTFYSGVFSCQLLGETTSNGETTKFEISPIFYIEVAESIEQGEETEYPIDPNITFGIDEYIADVKEQAKSEIEATGESVKASIPSDYSTLSSEISDIRTGADGTTYNSAGDSVRGQIGNLNDELNDVQILSKDIDSRTFSLELKDLAQKNGYSDYVHLDWESGSINYPSGTNKNPDVNVIRTQLPRFQLNGDIRFILLNQKYRIRYYMFPDETNTAEKQSGWYTAKGNYFVSIDTSKYYRIQIATQSGTTMDMKEALSSILVVYDTDAISNEVPQYWLQYIESKVQTINAYLTDGTNKTAFLFLTDTHWNESETQLNSRGINTSLMKYIKDRCNIDYLIHGGDLNCEYRSNKNIARQCMTKPMEMMRSVFDNVLVTRGNHDDNNESGYKNWEYTISQSDSYSYMFRNTKNVVFGETGTYFYHDIPFEKVRIISLDGIDFPYTNDVDSSLLDEKMLAYGYTQLQWLCDVLANTPNDYHIVFFTHEMIAPSIVTVEHGTSSPQTRASNYPVLANILKAYKNRQTYSESITGTFSRYHESYFTGTLTGDFTNTNASIVGVFSGHEHVDCIEEILDGNGDGIGIYNTCTQNSSAMFGDSTISHSYQHQMTIGTTTELVWDVVIIDRSNKHVDMIRIGASGSEEIREFNY